MTLKELFAAHGAETEDEKEVLITEWTMDSLVPALCDERCKVEPDGKCQHGKKSVLLVLGLL